MISFVHPLGYADSVLVCRQTARTIFCMYFCFGLRLNFEQTTSINVTRISSIWAGGGRGGGGYHSSPPCSCWHLTDRSGEQRLGCHSRIFQCRSDLWLEERWLGGERMSDSCSLRCWVMSPVLWIGTQPRASDPPGVTREPWNVQILPYPGCQSHQKTAHNIFFKNGQIHSPFELFEWMLSDSPLLVRHVKGPEKMPPIPSVSLFWKNVLQHNKATHCLTVDRDAT